MASSPVLRFLPSWKAREIMLSGTFMHRYAFCVLLLLGSVGCVDSDLDDDPPLVLDAANLVPLSGVVTVGGMPLSTVVVTFLPPRGPALAVGETDKDGRYELSSMGGKGILPGVYKVAFSYLVGDDGEPQGTQARTSEVQSHGMLTAHEQLPSEYSDLGRSKLSYQVGTQGARFDFDVPAKIPVVEKRLAAKKAGTRVSEPEPGTSKSMEKTQ
jgi:hypothetical protein